MMNQMCWSWNLRFFRTSVGVSLVQQVGFSLSLTNVLSFTLYLLYLLSVAILKKLFFCHFCVFSSTRNIWALSIGDISVLIACSFVISMQMIKQRWLKTVLMSLTSTLLWRTSQLCLSWETRTSQRYRHWECIEESVPVGQKVLLATEPSSLECY